MKRAVIIVYAVYSLLAIGLIVLTLGSWIGHADYPTWVKILWPIIDLLLAIATLGNAGFYLFNTKNEEFQGVLGGSMFCFAVFAFIFAFPLPDGLSIVIFAAFALFLFPNLYIIFAEAPERKEKQVEATLDVEPNVPVCSVCKISSPYDVCLICERKHQKEIQRVRSQNWRAKKAGEPATLTIAQWLQTLETFSYRCAYCQTSPYECMEHFIPIGKGTKDGGTTAKNCVPACAKCNAGKSNKHPEK